MKKILIQFVLLCWLLFGSVVVKSQVSYQDSIRFSAQLIKIEQQLLDDIPSGNTANWNKFMHPACFVVAEDGTITDKKAFLADFHGLPTGYSGYIKIIQPKTVFYNTTAVIRYVADEYENVFESKIHTTYGIMNTYIHTGTLWQMISSQVFEIPQLPPSIKVSPAVLERYTGLYRLSDSITCSVSLQNDTLYYQRSGRTKTALLPETENVFFRVSDTRGRKVFLPDEAGTMVMRERRNGQDVIWKKIPGDNK
jgi:hypothetical protein